jgi:hypothetical protein
MKKLSLFTHEFIEGSRGKASLILNLSIRWSWVVNFIPWPLYFWSKTPRYPLHKWLGGPQRTRLGVLYREKNLVPLLGIELEIFQPVASSLYWQCYPYSSL